MHILEENKIDEAWLGVHDLYEEGDWNTIMDEPMEATGYSKWNLKNDEPNNYDEKQHCGVLRNDINGGMGDVDCTVACSFFCEIAF